MNKGFKYLAISAVFIVVCYIAYFIFAAVKYSHSLDWGTTAKEYLFFFKESVRKEIDSNYSYSYTQKHDTYNNYIYKDKYYIIIWEFKDLKSVNINEIPINRDIISEAAKITSGETLNAHSSPEITIKYGFDFNNTMNISLNRESKIDSTFKAENYRGFYGTIDKMLFSNGKGKPLILFNYSNERQYGLFLLYKGRQNFYLLIINSKNPFDPKKLIKIFDLP